jgi:flagellar protein FlaG
MFGTSEQVAENDVKLRFFQGVYLSPQQAKAVAIILQQNIQQYESTFGEIHLEPRMIGPAGPIH